MSWKPVKANALAIAALKPRTVKYEVSIVGHAGLIIRVWPSGERTYVYRHRQDGKLRRVALRATTLGEAVREWATERQDARQGVDVSDRRRQHRASTKLHRIEDRRHPTITGLVARYLEEHAKRKKRSWRSDELRLNKYVIPVWGPLKARSVRRADVHGLVNDIAGEKPIQANRVLAVIRKMFSFAMDAGVLEAHPCLRMKTPTAERARSRILTDAEIRSLWTVADNAVLPPLIHRALCLQLLTGCRIGEVIGAHAAEFDLDANVWIIPSARTKNGLDHTVPLSHSALRIVQDTLSPGGYLFPWKGATGFLRSDTVAHHLLHATAALKLNHFSTHDLRRTAATRLGELGFSQELRQRILNHKNSSILAAHYDRYDHLKEKREALEAWARKLDEIIHGKSAGNVIKMKRCS